MKQGVGFCYTPALLAFRRIAGDANRHMNTLLVGVETLRKSPPIMPEDLVVGWSQPCDETQWADVRGFVLRTALVATVDGLNRYANILVALPGILPETDIDYVRGSWLEVLQRRPNVAERIAALARIFQAPSKEPYVAACHLLVAWRNRIVHSYNKFGLDTSARASLQAEQKFFHARHAGTDISDMLAEFDTGQPPSVRSMSTLFASAHNLIAEIDQALLFSLEGERYADALLRYLIGINDDPQSYIEHLWKYGGPRALGSIKALFLQNGGEHSKRAPPWAPGLSKSEFAASMPKGVRRALELYL